MSYINLKINYYCIFWSYSNYLEFKIFLRYVKIDLINYLVINKNIEDIIIVMYD